MTDGEAIIEKQRQRRIRRERLIHAAEKALLLLAIIATAVLAYLKMPRF